jgi:hypothetical protein
MSPKALIIIVTADKLYPRCLESIHNQDYDNYEVLINVQKPQLYPGLSYYERKNLNIANNREEARIKALKTDAQYFLWGDSDMVYPKHTLSDMVTQMKAKVSTISVIYKGKTIPAGQPIAQKHLMAGWYLNRWYKNQTYVMAQCVATDTIKIYTEIERSLIRVDWFGMGCVCLTRELLEKVKMLPGTDSVITNQFGKFYLDEGGALTRQVFGLGYDCWANGGVVCEHIVDEVGQQAERELRRKELIA